MKSLGMLEKVNKMSFQNLGEFYNIIHRIGSVNLQQQESFIEKIYYDRSTNSVAFCALQCMSLPPSFPSKHLKYQPFYNWKGLSQLR